MRKTLVRTGTLAAIGAVASLAACSDTTGPESPLPSSLELSYADGGTYRASGEPVFDGGDLSAATFATAFPDSVGGYVISSFQMTSGSRGDLFILQLTDRETGDHGPCGTGASCHGRILEDFDADQLTTLGTYWEIISGTVQIEQSGPDRLVRAFTDLTLQAQDSTAEERTVDSGTFDLELLSDEEGTAAMQCFLARTSGAVGC